MEKGFYTMDNGINIEAGSFSGASRFQKITLQQPYAQIPVILTQIITENDTSAVTGRIQNSDQSAFEYKLQEQESTKNAHAKETISYIAWEPGKGEIEGLLFETGLTLESVTDNGENLTFQTAFQAPPLFIAGMQTYEDRDTATLRTQSISRSAVEVKAEEEQSKNSKIDHDGEVVGYLVIGAQ